MSRSHWINVVAAALAGLTLLLVGRTGRLPWDALAVTAPGGTGNSSAGCTPHLNHTPAAAPSSDDAGKATTVHVALAACGPGFDRIGLTVVKSVLLARARSVDPERRLHVHVIVEDDMKRAFSDFRQHAAFVSAHPAVVDVLEYIADHTRGRVELTPHSLGELGRAVSNHVGPAAAANISDNLFKPCAAARLKLPYAHALANVPRLLYVDTDAVALCDIAQLWDGFAWPARALFAATMEAPHRGAPSMYQNLPSAFGGAGLNSGVLFFHLERMRAAGLSNVWREAAAVAQSTGYAGAAPYWKNNGLYFGDQDILNIMFSPARRPEWLAELDMRWNWRWPGSTAGNLRDGAPPGYVPPAPCIEHFNAGQWAAPADSKQPTRAGLFKYVAHARLLMS